MRLFGHTVLLLSLAVPALAQAAGPGEAAVSLSCRGSVTNVADYSRRLGRDDDAQRSAAAPVSTQRVTQTVGQMSVAIAGGAVMVRPRGALKPAVRSEDGWYRLRNVVMSETGLRGAAPYGDKPVLTLDTRSGAITFGAFAGACLADAA
jgi:hypothetical protein